MKTRIFSTFSLLLLLVTPLLGAISDHILYVEIEHTWDYGNASASDLRYAFCFTVEADSSVEYIEFRTPAGKEVVIVESEYCDDYGAWWKYEYDYSASDPSGLSEYGDGIYQMTVHYHDKESEQTSIEYTGLQQPMQRPVPVFPTPDRAVASPVIFQWESCTDPAPNNIWFDIKDLNGKEVIDTIDQSTAACGTHAIELDAGSYTASIGFENSQSYPNSDGIWISRWKTSTIEWDFTVMSVALVGSGTKNDPYLIRSLADFDEFANPENASIFWASGVYTKLMKDIDLEGRKYTSAVISPDIDNSYGFQGVAFKGIFSGNGKKIRNLEIDTLSDGDASNDGGIISVCLVSVAKQ